METSNQADPAWHPIASVPKNGTRVDLQDADGAIAERCHWGLIDGPGWSQHGVMGWVWAPVDFVPVRWRLAAPRESAVPKPHPDASLLDRLQSLHATAQTALSGATGDHALAVLANYGDLALQALPGVIEEIQRLRQALEANKAVMEKTVLLLRDHKLSSHELQQAARTTEGVLS